ncbi:MAG: oligoendopeptidase F [Treponema sp.]|nr:MAG: oligoendopeptidase F [Treponema sp.]
MKDSFIKGLPLVEFDKMPYERPDFKSFEAKFSDSMKKFEIAKNVEEQIEEFGELQRLEAHLDTMRTLCSIRNSIDTTDEFYEKETAFFDEFGPQFANLFNEFNKIFVKSKFRNELEKEFGEHIFNLIEMELKVFDPKIMEELVIENKLVTQYSKLVASAQVEFDGKKLTLSQLSPYTQNVDREVRKNANEAVWGFFEEHEKEFDQIYDELVKVRTKIAKKLGYENYVQLGYDRLNRTDYNSKMVENYRKQIFEEIVPLKNALVERKRKRLGLDKMYYYDAGLSFKTGNAVPKGKEEWILDQAKKMYSELSPETDEFFKMMLKYNLLDVMSKKGKAAGGYCTGILDYKVPFIFANFNGTAGDVTVMTHEAGHAFQAYQSRNAKIISYGWPTLEACEIHSMSMEFFTWPWMELFFKDQTEKFKFSHLSGAVNFMPYGATVDEFQHWVYENPEATPQERKSKWSEIEKKYQPHIDYADNDFLKRGGFWFRQGHIFSMPFYYIDYTLAQVCALQFWVRMNKDKKEAWTDYLKLCEIGGAHPFLKLLEIANLKNPFNEGCIAYITPDVKKWLDSVDDSQM